MKIVHRGYNLAFTIEENQVIVLSVENARVYTDLLQDIWSQCQGGEGDFIFSEKEKVLKVPKVAECIFNPFALECNNRKIVTHLYQEMKEHADCFLAEETMQINTKINQFLESFLWQMPYALKHNPELDILNLLKLYDVRFDSSADTVLEKIIEYLRVMSKICGIILYVFVGLKHYLNPDELKELYQFAFYEKIRLILLEPDHLPLNENEKGWIIDSDLCIIEL